MSNEFDELNKQCMEIAKQFNRAAKELLVQAEELIKLVQQIDQVILSGNVVAMQNLVRVHGEE